MDALEVALEVQDRGLITAILDLIEPSSIEDDKLAKLWEDAYYDLKALQRYLTDKTGVQI